MRAWGALLCGPWATSCLRRGSQLNLRACRPAEGCPAPGSSQEDPDSGNSAEKSCLGGPLPTASREEAQAQEADKRETNPPVPAQGTQAQNASALCVAQPAFLQEEAVLIMDLPRLL